MKIITRNIAKKLLLTTALLSMILTFGVSCKKNKVQDVDSDYINLEIKTADKSELVEKPKSWEVTPKRICVLFGYAFNKPEEYEPLLALLKNNYGLDDDGGLIYPLIYGESFKRGVRGYVSELSGDLQNQEKELIGVVVLGAPENTHKALANYQDFWDQEVPFPVISLFPQDDVLGMESTCDIVIDKMQSGEMSGTIAEDEEVNYMEDAPELLLSVINYIEIAGSSFKKDTSLQTHVQQMLGNKPFHRYTDPETGLQSINHFVLN